MERIMNEKNDWENDVEGDAAEGPVVCVSREVLQALNELKTGKDPGPSEVSLELIAACAGVGSRVMAEICQKKFDKFGMPAERTMGIVVPIFKGKGYVRNCSSSGAVKLLEHGMRVVERVL